MKNIHRFGGRAEILEKVIEILIRQESRIPDQRQHDEREKGKIQQNLRNPEAFGNAFVIRVKRALGTDRYTGAFSLQPFPSFPNGFSG